MSKKFISILLSVVLLLGFGITSFAAGDIVPYMNESKVISQKVYDQFYVSELGYSVSVSYVIKGYYMVDRASGAITNAYRCEVTGLKLETSPPVADFESFKIYLSSSSTSMSVSPSGSYASFTATLGLRLDYYYGAISIINYNLGTSTKTIKAYAA